MLGDVFLVGALEQAPELARRLALDAVDEVLDPDEGVDARGHRHVRALVVRAALGDLLRAGAQARHRHQHLEREGLAAVEDLIDRVEEQASSELFGLLKRPDEKYVTEHAYDNPKFVEDMVRDIAAELNRDARVEGYIVESENFESIHNHSAYAMIAKGMEPR